MKLRAGASAEIKQLAAVEIAGETASFGTIEAAADGGTVALSPSGEVTGPAAIDVSGAAAAPAFTVTAAPHTAFSLTVTSTSLEGPGEAIALSEVTHDAGSQPATGADGQLSVRLGATVAVNPDQAAGAYGGTTQVIVNY